MTSGIGKYVAALIFAMFVMTMVAGLAYATEKAWEHGWLVCVFVLLVILLALLGFGDSNSVELNLERCIARFHARKTMGRAKERPVFGDPDDPRYFDGDDRPLPANLTHRVAVYTHARRLKDPEGFDRDLDGATSFNALIRREIRAGRL